MPSRIDALTGLRFFAALAIVLHHLPGLLWLPEGAFGPLVLDQGVSFFFVLSGFVLQHAYRSRFHQIGYWRFLALRFFRLWPVHIVVVAIVYSRGPRWFDTDDVISSVFLLQAWRSDLAGVWAINGPAWSISAEVFFYAMFPLLTGVAAKRPMGVLLLSFVATALYFGLLTLANSHGFNSESYEFSNPIARLFEFVFGMCLLEFISRYGAPKGTRAEVLAIALVALVFVGVSYLVFSLPSSPFTAWLDSAGGAPAFAVLIAVFAQQSGALSRALSSKPLVYLGDTSFALYLAHQPLIFYASGRFGETPIGLQIAAFTAVLGILVCALHHFVEKPTMSLAKRWLLERSRSENKAQKPAPVEQA